METQKTFVKTILIIATVIIFIILISMWLGFGQFKDSSGNIIQGDTMIKFIFTLGGILLISAGWVLFRYQEWKDLKKK